ncbi:hypothetical protein THAOC_18542 [Thalassiosira oceanica]|uniref:Uncharacterized protein n=1 Tax=Thalassiosira oceanica TaxID=159749 RepID=K0S4G9_THAOC|nr:hypothetical protein THAOC_18542 [Thalassiosira oceanica]|eukprot:EJK61028.1 hypothetical protein THAOC_18542 [Thalassiosira oceanica]
MLPQHEHPTRPNWGRRDSSNIGTNLAPGVSDNDSCGGDGMASKHSPRGSIPQGSHPRRPHQGSPKSKDVVKAFTWMDIAWTTAARVGGADATVGTELEELLSPVKSPTKCAPILAATKRQLLATTATNTAIRNQLLRANRKEDISASPINAKKGRWSNVAIKTKMMASMHDDEEEEEDRTQTALGQRLAKYSADSSSQLPDGASMRGYIADRPERSHQLGLQLTPPRTSDAAFEVRGRQRRRRERRLTPLQPTTDRGWTKPPGTPAGNVTRYAALGSLD